MEGVVVVVLDYFKDIILGEDGKDVVIFDIDEIVFFNLFYYRKYCYG